MPGKTTALSPAQALAATVTVMDQHGKVVHNGSKTFFSAFREAKEAYRARKAEIAAERQAQRRAREIVTRRNSTTAIHRRRSEGGSVMALQDASEGDNSSAVVRHKKHRKHKQSGSAVGGASISEEDMIAEDALVREDALARRGSNFSDGDDAALYAAPRDTAMMAGNPALEMAPALFNDPSVVAVQTLLARVQSIIDELQCWTAGLSTLISELQKTPETLAAVGLSLAEIAQMVTHIAPGAMMVLKTAFPTVFALISSPHFAVVAGVGAAATVVVLGGYKIVKSIISGADENMKMAYGELPDEAILGGEILGEIIEEDRPQRKLSERVEELPPVGIPRSSTKHERKALPPPEDPITFGLREESRWMKTGNKDQKKMEKVLKVERKHEKDDKKKEKDERRREKEEKDERRKEKEMRRERRAASRQNSSSSGVSSNRSESGEDRSLKEKHKEKSKSKSGDKDEKEKKDKKNIIKALFNGRSA